MIIYLNNILIYIVNAGQAHVNDVWRVLDKLRKHGLFANLKKCWFYKDEIRFYKYVISAQKVQL